MRSVRKDAGMEESSEMDSMHTHDTKVLSGGDAQLEGVRAERDA